MHSLLSRPALVSVPGPRVALPIARVCVDIALRHLDRVFDYAVGADQTVAAVPGSRVQVRFAGRRVRGYVLDRVAASEHPGELLPLLKVVSPEPVLTPAVMTLCRAVADRYAGTLSDVLRLAIPPRVASVETEAPTESEVAPLPPAAVDAWQDYAGGPEFLAALSRGESPRAVLASVSACDPGGLPRWPQEIAQAVAATVRSGRGVLVVVPDARDLAWLEPCLSASLGVGRHTVLSAAVGPTRRYRSFLQAARGGAQVVVGTRAAVLAPVDRLGLVVVWDDADPVHKEPHAPYFHARDVALLRAGQAGAGVLLAGHVVSAEAAHLVRARWAQLLCAAPAAVRSAFGRVETPASDWEQARDPGAHSRLPSVALQAARAALARSEAVLVQVARRGYQPALACDHCRAPARCPVDQGPLTRASSVADPRCGWCARPALAYLCPACGAEDRRFRSSLVGADRTAEELARSFPGVAAQVCSGSGAPVAVGPGPRLVIATAGAEPPAPGGYGALLLPDAWLDLSRPSLGAVEEALRRWTAAAALTREGATVFLGAPATAAGTQAVVAGQLAELADREAGQRAELELPPSTRLAVLTGSGAAVEALLVAAQPWPTGTAVLDVDAGPGAQRRSLVRVPRSQGSALAHRLALGQRELSQRGPELAVRVELDPLEPLGGPAVPHAEGGRSRGGGSDPHHRRPGPAQRRCAGDHVRP